MQKGQGTWGHTPGPVCCFLSDGGETLLPGSFWGYGMVTGLPDVSFGSTLKLGFPAAQQLMLNPRRPFCP